MHYAASLIQKICGGSLSKIVSLQQERNNKHIKFNPEITHKLTGVKIENKISEEILTKLGFEINSNKTIWDVIVPSWRSDIDGVADIVEEIIRVNGYSSIPITKLSRNTHSYQVPISLTYNSLILVINLSVLLASLSRTQI